MNLNQFLAHVQTADWFSKQTVIIFKGNETYPLLFFSLLCSRIKQTHSCMVETIDLAEHDQAIILSKLQTSFLGMQTLYWLKNVSELDEKKRAFWLHHISFYQGPNAIAFFVNVQTSIQSKNEWLTVAMPDAIDAQTFNIVLSFFCPTTKISATATKHMFDRHDVIPLDAACVLMHYALVLGTHIDQFIEKWLDNIITPDRSLFNLSSALFAKKPEQFFTLWSKINGEYADVFWVAFWSEQLWRAHHFVALSQAKQFEQAKKIGMRLPFSFLQRDWKLHTPEHLLLAHQAIYDIDHAFKNGGNVIGLDLFYSKFFLNKF